MILQITYNERQEKDPIRENNKKLLQIGYPRRT